MVDQNNDLLIAKFSSPKDEWDVELWEYLAFDVAQEFYLAAPAARNIAREVGEAVRGWRRDAELAGAGKREIDFMSSAFEHKNLREALQGG